MIYIVLGPPGCGKGTQAKLLAQRYKLTHISTGDLIRREYQEKTPLGLKAYEHIRHGGWAPTPLVEEMLLQELARYPEGDFVLEGWPRYPEQKEILDKHLAAKGLRVDKVFYLETPAEVAAERVWRRVQESLVRGETVREDDSEETIKKRLAIYFKNIEPVLAYYREKGVLEVVDNRPPIEEVTREIIRRIDG